MYYFVMKYRMKCTNSTNKVYFLSCQKCMGTLKFKNYMKVHSKTFTIIVC